ncbi:MAG: ABC transporter ATP-binding protein [Magnetococcales bacterium]|nr:ABC transporter ATP-binding protein [Magnetococcales bacterium]NGZ25646.1 ABC transporter ATP-binding protein [Magnetococcales bacterium]
MMPLFSFIHLIRNAPPQTTLTLFGLMLLAGITDGVGIMLLVPLLNSLQGNTDGSPLAKTIFSILQKMGISPSVDGLLLVFLLLVAGRSVLLYFREILSTSLQHRLVDRLRHRCFAALLAAEWRWVVTGRSSDHASFLSNDISRVGTGLYFALSLIVSFISLVSYLVVAFFLSWQMTLFAILSGGIVFLLLVRQRRRALQLGTSLGQANRAIQSNLQESLAGFKLAKILGSEARHLTLFDQVIGLLRHQQEGFSASTSLSRSLLQVGGAFLLVGYLYVGLHYWQTPVSELLILVLIFSRVIPMFSSVQQHFHHWLHAHPALLETEKMLQECAQNAEPHVPSPVSPWSVQEAICLQNITVHYPERASPALDHLCLCLPAKTTTAIMGTSGAGKSTLADVLAGLLLVDEGELIIDGIPVTGGLRLSWRRNVAYVPQEVFLFNHTIRHNLLWGKPDATEEELTTVLRQAAAEFVFQLPNALDTVVGDGGIRLSGGERQRLALARALLKKPSLLILDEATSALDKENELRLRTAIENLHGDLTVVLIGHRLATLEHADLVVILEQGRIHAKGSWQTLSSQANQLATSR